MSNVRRPMNDLHAPEDLKHHAPTLAGLPARDPFVVSEGFFDRFPHEVQAVIAARASHGSARYGALWLRRAALALPLIAILIMAWWSIRTEPGTTELAVISAPSVEGLSALEERDLLALLSDEDLNAMGTVAIDLDEDEMAAYVEHEGLDLTDYVTEP